MPAAISVVSAPTVPADLIDDVAVHLRLDLPVAATPPDPEPPERLYLSRLIDGAIGRVEQYTGRRLFSQTLEIYPESTGLFTFPVAPVSTIVGLAQTNTEIEEYVYILTATSTPPTMPTGGAGTDDFRPTGWDITPPGRTTQMPYEWLSVRSRADTTTAWTDDDFAMPVLFSGPGPYMGEFQPPPTVTVSSIPVRCEAGYGADVASIPAGLLQAIYTIVAGWYEARQDWVQGGPPGQYGNTMISESIMDPYRLSWAF